MILDLYWTVTEPRGRFQCYQSLLISQIVFDVISSITVIIFDICFWLRGDLLAYLQYNLTQKIPSKQIQVKSKFSKIFRILVVFTQIISLPLVFAINLHVQLKTKLDVASVIASSIRLFCLTAFVNSIRLVHVNTIEFVKNKLRATF